MDIKQENIERIQTRIDMIRQESRALSYRIERMTEQRKALSQEKNDLKERLEVVSSIPTKELIEGTNEALANLTIRG
jgi:predicted  nucleic acid-binding Zn-ribbon protein